MFEALTRCRKNFRRFPGFIIYNKAHIFFSWHTCFQREKKKYFFDSTKRLFVLSFKTSVPRNFRPRFFPWFELIKAPDKQAKVFSNSVLILPIYSIKKFENSDQGVPKKETKMFNFVKDGYTLHTVYTFLIVTAKYSANLLCF